MGNLFVVLTVAPIIVLLLSVISAHGMIKPRATIVLPPATADL